MPKIDQRQLARAALELLDLGGPEALDSRTLAGRLGCRHDDVIDLADSRVALIDLACDAVYAKVVLEPDGQSWAERMRDYSRSYRRALLQHPRAVPYLAVRPIQHDAGLNIAERALAELTEVGFSPEEANRVVLVIVSFVNGHVLTEIGVSQADHHEVDVDLVARTRRAAPLHQLPILAQIFATDNDRDAEFELGIDLLVGGLERHLLHAAPR
ncbi:MAG: TetR/AcrR family transcriptional regulator C-terminal domain-containing protein [Acidimicrobiales bacterium]